MKATATQSNTFFPNDFCCSLLVQIFYPNQINVENAATILQTTKQQ